MNRKGQLGILSVIFGFFIFILIWAVAGGKLLKEHGENAVLEHGYTGIIAFILTNMNLFVFIGLILGIVIFVGIISR
jgi:hypothetical protein